jgi:glucose-1-phosphate adenylyltransferase
MDRKRLIEQVREAYVQGQTYFERDVLAPHLDTLNVLAYEHTGYYARILDLKSYFDENMKMLKAENVEALFSPGTIYTKIRDDTPTRYAVGSHAKNVMVADGCVIEGEVENCILFRGVKVGKGAKVRNCVLMQDTVVETGASIEYAVTDKNVTITAYKELKGTDSFPVFVEKHKTV